MVYRKDTDVKAPVFFFRGCKRSVLKGQVSPGVPWGVFVLYCITMVVDGPCEWCLLMSH